MAFPSLVPEAVVISAVSVKADVEPVLVLGIPFFLLYVLKSPKTPAHMVEHTVQHDFHIVLVEFLADSLEVLVRSKAAVDFQEISCVIPVVVGFKDWI